MWIIDNVVDGDSYQYVFYSYVFWVLAKAHYAAAASSAVLMQLSVVPNLLSSCWFAVQPPTLGGFSCLQSLDALFCRFGSAQRLFSDKHLRIQSPAGDRVETVPFSVVSNCEMSMDEYHVFHGDRAKAKVPQITKHEVCSMWFPLPMMLAHLGDSCQIIRNCMHWYIHT